MAPAILDPAQPPFKKEEALDKVEIDSFECNQCHNEAIAIVYLPCKHFYLCDDCYKGQGDKFSCGECHQMIDGLVKVYVTNNN